jgi:hypothetical protein
MPTAEESAESTFPHKPVFDNLTTRGGTCVQIGRLRKVGSVTGENLDISEGSEATFPRKGAVRKTLGGKRFIGINFACCDVYSRIYINRTETAYEGRCPKCSKPIVIQIGHGGTDQRFFTAR